MESSEVKKIKEQLEALKEGYEQMFDEHSERWQDGEKGEQCMSNIDACQRAIEALEEIE